MKIKHYKRQFTLPETSFGAYDVTDYDINSVGYDDSIQEVPSILLRCKPLMVHENVLLRKTVFINKYDKIEFNGCMYDLKNENLMRQCVDDISKKLKNPLLV